MAVTCVWLGHRFAVFYRAAREGQLPLPERPPGVEGFLPISGVMGLVDWIRNDSLNPIHPAATVLVLIAVALSFLLRKSFCSWICPIGTLSEWLARAGRRLFGRNFRIWTWLDHPLRALKYLLLAFFLYNIFTMGAIGLRAFLNSPYNRVADIKMGLFFAELSATGIVILAGLALGSVLVQGFWCRYLCPYGALLGLFSWVSPTRVERDPAACIDCGLCDRVCMARLPVSTQSKVLSPECTGCLDCVAVCPVGEALSVRTVSRRVRPWVFALAVVLVFAVGYLGARGTGRWQNRIGDEEYIHRIQQIDEPGYGHPGR